MEAVKVGVPQLEKSRKLVIVGDSAFAEIAWTYFQHESSYDVAGFAVEANYLRRTELQGLPVVEFETLQKRFPADEHDVFVAVTYTQLNRLRTRLVASSKAQGYALASFISPHAFVHRTVTLGEHCFIFEGNVIQPFVRLEDNVVLWSGNHIGHHSTISSNVFVSSHVVISGFCHVESNCFLGVNSSISNNVTVASDCWIGPGVVIGKDTAPGELYRSAIPLLAKVSAPRFFRVEGR